MKRIGVVSVTGGGYVSVFVDRELDSYPDPGVPVYVAEVGPRDLTVNQALDLFPDAVNTLGQEVIDRLAPSQPTTISAAVGVVLAELYRAGLIDFTAAT